MTNTSGSYPLPYPESTDPVNVHGDIKDLASSVSTTFQALNLSVIQLDVRNLSGSTILAGTPVYAVNYSGLTTIDKAMPTTSPILGLLKTTLQNNETGVVVVAGVLHNINLSAYSVGDVLYVAEGGGLTKTRPAGGSGAVGIVAKNGASGIVIVEAKGNGTWGALKAGLA